MLLTRVKRLENGIGALPEQLLREAHAKRGPVATMGAAFGMPALTDAQADLRFSAPVPVGATVTYHCTASDGPGLFDLRVTLVDGHDVIGGQIRVEGLT